MRILLFLSFLLCSIALNAQPYLDYEVTAIDGAKLDGRLLDDAKPFQRVPECYFERMTEQEQRQASRPVGQFLTFRTQSTKSGVIVQREGVKMGLCNGPVSSAGFDLYIRKDSGWLWAGSVLPEDGKPCWLICNMDDSVKECLLYMPLGCKVTSMQICHSKGSSIVREQYFRNNIAVLGSSFTEGAATSRSGMTWTAQLSRRTGMLFANFGFAGNCKLQDYFSDMLVQMDVDAYVIDGFSNPSPQQMRERLFPFIEKVKKHKPQTPVIFLKSIYREKRNFDRQTDKYETERAFVSDSLMKDAVRTFDNVYWVTTTNATDSKRHETSVDGTHPSDYGYTLWAESVERQIVRILRKHKIK